MTRTIARRPVHDALVRILAACLFCLWLLTRQGVMIAVGITVVAITILALLAWLLPEGVVL